MFSIIAPMPVGPGLWAAIGTAAVANLMPWPRHRKPGRIRINGGLNIAIAGAPKQQVSDGPEIATVALMVGDSPGVRPRMEVSLGDRVVAGDVLFADRRHPAMAFTAPGAGVVTSVTGRESPVSAQRVEIRLDGDAARRFDPPGAEPAGDDVRALLLESGLWPALRARPFGTIADPGANPDAVFVTAIDTFPLAADPRVVIAAHEDDFHKGLEMVKRLTDGPLFVCQGPGPDLAEGAVTFAGRHPAGLAGTHIHHLHPARVGGIVWHLDYQDTIAIGHLFNEGRLWTGRIIALAGPGVREPRLVRTRLGANLEELTAGELLDSDMRVISGSVLSGRKQPFLGSRHLQVSVINEGWDAPNMPFPPQAVSTELNGTPGPLIPLADFEKAMAMDILPVPLLRALGVGDRAMAERLGCVELVEEDVALLSYLCPGKGDYGALLRAILDDMEADR